MKILQLDSRGLLLTILLCCAGFVCLNCFLSNWQIAIIITVIIIIICYMAERYF